MTNKADTVCGCCAGVAVATPRDVHNRPGLDAIAYRVGDYPRFRQTLRARLSAKPGLAELTTRDDDDFALAWLDAGAAMCDVLTFYQERIANEHYLPTARERRSAVGLSDLVGYRLQPGVAANVWLAFTLESASLPGDAPETVLEAGIRVQSVPGPGETAQVFETVESVSARPEWNSLRPRLTRYQEFDHATTSLLLDGLVTGLKRGDGLILTTDADGSRLSLVTSVEPDMDRQVTLVALQPLAPPDESSFSRGDLSFGRGNVELLQPRTLAAELHPPATASAATALPSGSQPGSTAAPSVVSSLGSTRAGNDFGVMLGSVVSGIDLYAGAQLYDFDVFDLFAHLQASSRPPQGVLALRTKAAIFGHNAPRWGALPVSQRSGEYGPDPDQPDNPSPPYVYIPGPYRERSATWVDGNTLASFPDPYNDDPTPMDRIYLDTVYQQLAPDSYIAIKSGNAALVYQIDRVDEVSKSDMTLSSKVSRLMLRFPDPSNSGLSNFPIRASTVFAQSEELTLARLPIDEAVAGLVVELDGWVEGLYTGQKLIVCGERSDLAGVHKCEPVEIDRVDYVTGDEGFTRVTLTSALQYGYVRDSVAIHANVALATHGETVSETLGGGDPRVPWQQFELKQPPLTYVSSSDPDDAGARSTLEVRIDGVEWHEKPSFFAVAPDARTFVTRRDDEGHTSVQFGDGRTGARPPGGTGNIEASYRKGIGAGGNVRADQIGLLLTRPLGLKEVVNPLAASGGADAETLGEAQHNVPLSVRTLGRVVSLVDYADFARAFAGVDKAHAAWIWDGKRRVVALTVAGTDGDVVESGSPLHDNLLAALRAGGDASVPMSVMSYRKGLVRIRARLRIDPDYEDDVVIAAADAMLRERLSFDARSLGESLAASQVTTWLQNIEGVVAVDLDALYRALEAEQLASIVFAGQPQASTDGLVATELLTLDAGGLDLGVMI